MKRLTKKSTFLFAVAIVGLTFILLSVFLSKFSAQERDRHAAIIYLRQTTELQHRLHEIILEAHAFRIESYDPIVEVTRQIELICPAIENLNDAFLFSYNEQTAALVHQYCLINEKTLLSVERFKSKNSLLRNSIKYLPGVINDLKVPRNKSFALGLYSDVLLYCLQPKESVRARIETRLNKIADLKRAGHSESQQLSAFAKHARLVLESASARAVLEEQIYSPLLKEAIAKFTDSYLIATDRLETRSQVLKTFAIMLLTGLLLTLLYLLYRLQSSADLLSQLNLTLESKVSTRTYELKKALSDLEAQQEFLAQTAKMSALGEMAGGVAHEINTPLAAISLKAEMLLLERQNPVVENTLNEIVSIVGRVAKIVMGLKTFSRSSSSDAFRKTSIKKVIDDTLILCSQKFAINSIRLEVETSSEFELNCNPEQLSQVLLNLLNNAFDAVSELSEKWVKVEAKADSEQLILTVTDSGHGISESIQSKIMQPFFTTKEVGKGTGIGLSISKGIIGKHGGELTYDKSCLNTRFKIIVPLKYPSVRAA